jgi:phenylacetate-CoA ligase
MANPLTRLRWTAFTAWHLRRESSLPFWPLERVLALQSQRVRRIVRFAWREIPFYREAMSSAGLRPEAFRTAEDLARLPLIRRNEVISNPAQFCPSRRRLSSLRLESSGTSGLARHYDYEAAAIFLSLAHGYRQRLALSSILGQARGYREAVIARKDGVARQIREFYETHSWLPARWDLRRIQLSPGETFLQILGRLEEFRPDVVWGYGGHLGAFYRWLSRQNAAGHLPKAIVYGGDRMVDADRTLIEEQLGVPVFSFYQAVESLRIAFQCEVRQGLHLSLDQIAVRVIDGSGRDLGPGDSGEIVISNLTNRATVLLNYCLGDVVTLGRGPCPCGRSLPTLERIEGRADDLVLLPDGSALHALSILPGLQAVPGVVQVQLVQEELRRFLLRVVCSDGADWALVLGGLSAPFIASVGNDATLRIERVPRIAPDSGGKVRAVISRCRGYQSGNP